MMQFWSELRFSCPFLNLSVVPDTLDWLIYKVQCNTKCSALVTMNPRRISMKLECMRLLRCILTYLTYLARKKLLRSTTSLERRGRLARIKLLGKFGMICLVLWQDYTSHILETRPGLTRSKLSVYRKWLKMRTSQLQHYDRSHLSYRQTSFFKV